MRVIEATNHDRGGRTAESTLERVAHDLAHKAFPEMARSLHACSDRVIRRWRDLSLAAMPHMQSLTREQFEDTVAVILSAAADALESADPTRLRGVIEHGPQHGIDRFVQKHSILDLFEEVRILRGVIVVELAEEMGRSLEVGEAGTFHAIFDIIVQQGVMALVGQQTEELRRTQGTLRDMNEQLLVSASHQHELTEQARNAEGALRESEDRYRTLFDLGPVAIYSIDTSGVIQTFNRRAAELWGREPALGDTDERFCGSFKMFRPDGSFMAHDRCPMAEVVTGGVSEVRDAEVHIERPDGSRVAVLVNIRPLFNRRGEITGAVNCFYDITERKRAEKATAHLAAIVTSSEDAIIGKDINGVITSWNRGAEHLFGYANAEVVGKPVTLLIPEDHVNEEAEILARVRRGEVIQHYETVRKRKDGTLLNISLTVSPLRDGAGRIVGASKIARDITERVEMQKRLAEQTETIAGESRRKDEFLAMLSHELRNPLAPIRSAVHLMRMHDRTNQDTVQRQSRDVIERQVANLTKLVSDLLEVSRVVSGRIRLNLQPLDVNQVLGHAIETARPMIERGQHRLCVHLCPDGLWTSADSTRLEEVFVNLLNNAAKYTDPGGLIEVFCERVKGAGRVQVRIRDNGIGIEESLLPRIFDLFTQADRSLDRSAGGLGIGLSLAHRLVELHGGTIEVRSPPKGQSRGSEFIVRLPSTPGAEPARCPAHAEEPPPIAQGGRVLVVDDNIDQAMMVSSSLRHVGYSVQSAYTGPEGLKVALQWRPDIVLMDIGLPGLNGYELARRLRSDPGLGELASGMRLIALTGYGRDADVARAREAGFDAHLVKPFDFDELERLMRAPRGSVG